MMQPLPFGKYLLVERLAQGGMAEVFRAVYQAGAGVEKTVALKRILPGLDGAGEFIEMFIDEARIAASLTHVNVAQVFDFGEVAGTYYLAMELVDGVDLGRLAEAQRRRARGDVQSTNSPVKMAPTMAAFIIAEAARGLAYAHDRRAPSGALLGIVHRDVSPQNVLCSYAGEVKIADFGIAKAVGKLHKTASGALMGKLRYMSPEQVTGEPLDGRSDVFSLGVVLWELVTGVQLFDGEHPGQVTEQVKRAETRAPSKLAPGVPAELDRICLKALARDREARYARAADLARELGAFVAVEAPGLSREDLAAYVAALAPRGGSTVGEAEAAPAAIATTMAQPLAQPTRAGRLSPKPLPPERAAPLAVPRGNRRWLLAMVGAALVAGTVALAWRGHPVAVTLPPVATLDLGRVAMALPSPLPAPVSAEERERLLASLEALPQAEAAWRGVPSEDYLAIVSAAEASLCATPAGTREPSLPADVLDRLERRKVTGEARALARYLLLTGELPERVGLSLHAFLRGRPAFSPGAGGWAVAGLATLVEPDDAHHLEELLRENGALGRWRETAPLRPPGRPPARFADICERPAAVARLAARVPGPLSLSLARYLAALPVEQSVDEGGLRFAVIGAERDEAEATLVVRLRVTNPGAEERALPVEATRLSGLSAPPLVDPPGARLGAGLVREVRLQFSSVPDAVADAAVLILRPGLELQAYSEVLR
jgi:Protein kinase domain